MRDITERLRAVGCDREPFTPEHKDCICRLTNAAANEIECLGQALEKFVKTVDAYRGLQSHERLMQAYVTAKAALAEARGERVE